MPEFIKLGFWIRLAALIAASALVILVLSRLPQQPSDGSESVYTAAEWVDYYHGTEMPWDGSMELELPEFPGVTFRWTPGSVEAVTGSETTELIFGMPVWNVYLADLTGDGLPELCATVSFCSGIVDTHVVVYDYAEQAEYTLWQRMKYDYSLSLKGGVLTVSKAEAMPSRPDLGPAVLETGPLILDKDNGTLQLQSAK